MPSAVSQGHRLTVVSGSLGAVLQAEIGAGPGPKPSSASSTAGGAVRTWTSVRDFTQEMAAARIYDGVHYRNSSDVGPAMGQKIGELAVKSFPEPRADTTCFDYRYARRRPQVIAPVHSTSENSAASLAGAGVVPPVSHRAADLKGQW